MTDPNSTAGVADTGHRTALFNRRAPLLLSGVSLLALLATAMVTPASAATFTAANQAELYQAITDAQAHGDASSTITLTGSFSLTAAPPSIAGKTITVVTGAANTLTLASGAGFDVASGASLTIRGNVLGNGVLNQAVLNKTGTGILEINGVTASGITNLGVIGGTMVINGGSNVAVYHATTSTTPLIAIARNAGNVATLTISGAGTVVNGSGTDALDIGNSTGEGTLNVLAGAVLNTTSGVRQYGKSNINVSGAGSILNVTSINQAGAVTGTINITAGGVLNSTSAVTFGGIGNIVQVSPVTGVVSGAGSKLTTGTTLYLQRGKLSVLDGGVVEANAVAVAAATSGTVIRDFDVIVSGAGSLIDTNSFALGARGRGTLTLANDGKVSIGDGTSALVLGGSHVDSNATLNIGGAVGEAATAAGTLEASAITLAVSADINFNHTETGYVFDIPINGAGAINQVAGRTIFNASQAGFTGLTSISGGMLEVNNLLGGTVNITGGTLAGTGTVGATTLAAAGAIAPGSNGIGTLTIAGDYTSTDGLLQIQTALGDDTSATDLLVINGNSTGTTNVRVTNLGGAGGQTVNGIKIIDVVGTSTGTFSLLGDTEYEGQQAVIGGAYLYGLHQGTITDADGDWYLRSILNPDDDTPVFQPAAPVIETYAAAALQAFNASESLQQRVGNRSWSDDTEGAGIWGRIEARHTSLGPDGSTTSASYAVDTWRLQAGVDGVLSQSEAGTVIAGVNLQAGTISADISSASGDGSIDGTALGLGATLTWYAENGFYLDAQGKLNWFDSTLVANRLDGALVSGNAGFGYALSFEAGQRLTLGDGWSVTPQAQLSYSDVDFESFDSYGSTVALKSGDSLLARLGISADYETEWQDTTGEAGRTHLYGIANLSYEFLQGMATSVGADTLVNKADPLWGSVGFGGSFNWAGDALSLYGEANVGTSLNHLGDSYSLGVTAGIRGKL
jgi:fibronectin-binding autotransporter adhesin